ncbi:MAG: TonB-dependent receptor [Chitinophagales bacterium]|nr:TonB-dependent receptor [Chitinophagaceae bacterium]MBP9882038.1 TonB-dependent receptor [Chitinophagales bacterium]
MRFRFATLFILICSFPAALWAQNATVRGLVFDKGTGEPVLYTNVILKGKALGAQTNEDGLYNIANVPPGSYIIFCTQLGYDSVEIPITVKPNEILNQKIFLEKSAIELQNVNISAIREEKKSETSVSMTRITAKDIARIPSVGGEADLAQYLQVLPGVVFTGDQGGELYIRGGSPIQNKVLLDGMTIYNPFHSIGLFSVFETDIIRNVKVFTGGFSAEYGDRLSAVLDVTTRDGNKKQFSGKVAVNPFLSKVVLEGPIKKINDAGSSVSYMFTGKTSYLDQSSKLFYSYIDTGGLPYSFTDLYGKISLNGSNGSKLSFFGFNFDDHVDYQFVSEYDWKSFGFGTNFVIVPGGSKVLIGGTISYSDYEISLQEGDGLPRTSGINGFDLNIDFTYFVPNGDIKYGFDIGGFRTELQFYNSLGLKIEQNNNTTELSGFIVYKHIFNEKFILEPSLRLQYYASLPAFSPEPRISLKYNLTENVRLKAAAGLYSQNFISTKSDQDVVNLFTGFLTAPDGQLYDINGEPVNNNLQRASQAVIGVEADLLDNLELTVEPYFKNFGQLININRSKLLPTDPNFEIEQGQAYGLDFLVKYDYRNFYLWVAYSLGYVTRDNGEQEYPPHFDRRHNLNIVASYTWGKDRSWEVDARFNFGSGFPFTLTQGFYEQINFLDGINTNYTTQNGDLGIVYDDSLNTGRLPYYHRVDIAIKKKIQIAENSMLELNASVINVYNRENIFYFDRVNYERVNQLPILPSIGASLTF